MGAGLAKRLTSAGAFIVTVGVLCAGFLNARVVSRAQVAFDKLRELRGNWKGKDDHGMPVKSNFKVMVSDTMVMETLAAAGMEEMATFYSVSGSDVALVHYCPTNNQPRMRAVPPADGEVKELDFTFQGAGNLPNLETGHQHRLVIQFHDKDHITERWTWRQDGKDTDMIFQLSRKDQ
jgi:hypothetical protein